ncbi:MAG: two-component sensor histidine kinase BarA, partial [Bryobacterales bacterium]|nr:two-component sensor histidine kinase BarA [Bryobacterales bacterium]
TGDEIEFLGQSFNKMIDRLISTQNEVRQHQELLEERIRQRTHQLELAMQREQAANQAKSEFLANMSHELRTPMNGVLGMIDMVLDSSLNADQRDQLETAQRCANSLLALLNDVLDLSKIEAGKMVLERIPFDLRVLVDDTVRSHRPKASKKDIVLTLEIAPDAPRRISADPLRLRQILSNLLSNAVKFTEHGSVRISVARRSKEHGGDLVLEVADTGVGIPEDKLSYIFEKFTQADGSISRKYGGTGLGLAITKKLVDMHGG